MFFCLKLLESARAAEAAATAHWHTTAAHRHCASEAATTVAATVTTTATAHWHTAHHATHHTHTGSTGSEEVQTIAGAEHDVTGNCVVLVIGTGHSRDSR